MKVGAPSTPGAPAARGSRPAAAGGFAPLVSSAAATAPAAVSATGAVASLDALMALQQEDGPLERRRRAVRRAGTMLDLLDEVKLSLLDGEPTAAALERLTRAVRSERDETGDAGLEGILDEIETRAQVELAKLDVARAA